jgi:hypothetical protein
MAMLRPARRLNNADFPTFGRPTIATFPASGDAPSLSSVNLRVRVPFKLQLSHTIPHVDNAGYECEETGGRNDVGEGDES